MTWPHNEADLHWMGIAMLLGTIIGLVVSFWMLLFVATLAGSAWCLATAYDDWQGDWRGVWHRSPKRDVGVQHGVYTPFTAEEYVAAGLYGSVDEAVATYADFKGVRLRREGDE